MMAISKRKKSTIKNLIWRALSDTTICKMPHECNIPKEHLHYPELDVEPPGTKTQSNAKKIIQTNSQNQSKYFNIHFDAAWNDSKIDGFGFHFTDNDNRIIIKGMSNGKAISPLAAETWALWINILLAKILGIKHIKVFSNCLRLTNILNRKFKSPWSLSDLISYITLHLATCKFKVGFILTGI
ncbi:non-LTR retroelement reverse transcriptase [Canna indica]|uniref:Non-LTR retroelement reverse transcriptase n=1 Tax=Canna indica TaxID=4628 RepID=A0AAQ3KKB9_9LILI|nr:non-LTR retroelement reverse transcriptase [Canna indica]